MSYIISSNLLQPNFAEIELSKDEVAVFRTEYSKELFDECIGDDNKSYFYYRDGRYLYALPEPEVADRPIGFDTVLIDCQSSPGVISKLIAMSLKHFFELHNRKVFKVKYSSLYTFNIASEPPFQLDALELTPNCYFSVHHVFANNKVIFIFTLAKEYKPLFVKELNEIEKQGVDTRDFDIKNDRVIASRSNVKKYLERTNMQAKYDSEMERISSKTNEHHFIEKTFEFISKNSSNIGIGGINISKVNFLSLPNTKFDISLIQKPIQYYYNKNTTKGYTHTAISQLKPLSFDQFYGKPVSICAFIPKSDAKQCERMLSTLHENLVNIFHLTDINIDHIYVDEDRREHADIISKFSSQQFDLSIIFLYRNDKEQQKSKSAYNRLKAKLISKQIPSQTVLVENARTNNEYTLRNLSLNVYAKIGGTPWSIEKDSSTINEFVIGVGSTIDEQGTRNIGFASVFDHLGSYIVGSCSPLCKISDYRANLQNYISQLITEVVEVRSIPKGSKIRLTFHLFKDASRKYELSAINQCLEEFTDYEIEFAILSVSYNHPFKLFKNIKDQLDRGCFIKLSANQALMSMGGKGSTPLLVKLDSRSTYKDLFELTKQILFFSHLSHRSFSPGKNPVTVVYPHRLAQLTSDLLAINHWDIDSLYGMRDKLWFI
ncbi:Piwi domain-containing protein [Rheinheimera baltica]|uniref:Piwi domain-containing protein n=1 Tax=Rheinheimera baltica TaxID=67576 RepID=UPI00273D30B9|nr:Piwi domain-containing protein [Rheinheimera baltica]MDP5141606.1 Piwi domain-containing protein [Rheinheimera baltica]